MKFASFEVNGRQTWGIVTAEGVADCGASTEHESLQSAIESDALSEATVLTGSPMYALDTVRFRPLLPNPRKIICVGLNYIDHAAETKMEAPGYPVLFIRHANSLVAHEAPLIRPKASTQFDYEGELVAVIGRSTGRRVKKEHALSYVCGYSIFNDASVRDYQFRSHQWYMGKNFDGTGAFGPYLVTPDELEPGGAGLRIRTRLNGRVLQDATTSDMIFDVAALISIITEGVTLDAGDVIVTGTPSGVGYARRPPVFLKAGDLCEVEIDRLGILRNRVADE